MEINEILKKYFVGRYVIQILTNDNHIVKESRFDNLFDAINYAGQLTIKDCAKESTDDVGGYGAHIVLEEEFGEENPYPSLCYF